MFEVTTKNAEGWKAIIGLSWSLNEEAVINITERGLDFKVMDVDRSGLIDFEWKKENMIDFKCDQEQKIGFRTEDFNKILKRASSNDVIKLSHTGQGIMTIKIGEDKSYELRLVSTDLIETGSTPKITFDEKIVLPYEILKEKVNDMVIIGDFVEITLSPGQISFTVQDDGKKGTTVYRNESIKVKEEVKAEYSLSHLENALKTIKCENVSLGIQDKRPLCMELIMSDVGEIKYYLAPHQKN